MRKVVEVRAQKLEVVQRRCSCRTGTERPLYRYDEFAGSQLMGPMKSIFSLTTAECESWCDRTVGCTAMLSRKRVASNPIRSFLGRVVHDEHQEGASRSICAGVKRPPSEVTVAARYSLSLQSRLIVLALIAYAVRTKQFLHMPRAISSVNTKHVCYGLKNISVVMGLMLQCPSSDSSVRLFGKGRQLASAISSEAYFVLDLWLCLTRHGKEC